MYEVAVARHPGESLADQSIGNFKVAFERPPHPSLILAGHRGVTVPHKTVAVLRPYARGWLEWRSQELGH